MSDPLNDEIKATSAVHIENLTHVPHLDASTQIPVTKHEEGLLTVLGTSGQDPNKKKNVGFTEYVILVLSALAQFQNVFFGIAPAASAYAIAGALNGMDKRIWIVQAAGIPSIITGPIMAIISDIYGRRYVVIAAWLIMAVSAIIGMTANSMNVVIFAQALAGVAGGISGTMFAIPSEIVPSRYRSHAQTWINAFGGLASVPALIGLGAATGADPINGWRWVFRSLLIMDCVLLVGFGAFYFPPARTLQKSNLWKRITSLDWIGYFLLFAGLVPFLMGFAWAGDSNYGWSNPHAYGCVIVGAVGFIACLIYEWKGRDDGFLHHALFRNGRNFPISILAVAVEGSLFYLINNLYSSQVYTLWQPAGGITAALWLIPFFMTIIVVSPWISLYVTKYRDVKWPVVAGFVFYASSVIGLGTTTPNSKWAALGYNILAGIGFSSPLILLMTLVQLSTPPLFIGVASALTISARTLGGVVGYAIAEAIYNSIFNKQVPAAIAAAVLPLGFDPANLGGLIVALLSHGDTTKVPGVTSAIIAAARSEVTLKTAYAFRVTWLAFLPGVLLAVIMTAFFKNPKERMNWVVDAPLRHEAEHEHLQTME